MQSQVIVTRRAAALQRRRRARPAGRRRRTTTSTARGRSRKLPATGAGRDEGRDDGAGQARGPRRRRRPGDERTAARTRRISSSSSRGSSRRWRLRCATHACTRSAAARGRRGSRAGRRGRARAGGARARRRRRRHLPRRRRGARAPLEPRRGGADRSARRTTSAAARSGEVFPDWDGARRGGFPSPRAAADRVPSPCRSRSAAAASGSRSSRCAVPDGVVYAFRDLTGERRLEEAEERLRRDDLARAAHADGRRLRRRADAAPATTRELTDEQRRQLLEMIVTQAARLSQITEEVLLDEQPRPRRAAGRASRGRRRRARPRRRSRRSARRSPTRDVAVEIAPEIGDGLRAIPTGSSRCSSTCSTTRVKYGGDGAV